MFLIVTRNFPPDIGGMQFLMGGLSEGLVNHGPVKVFTFDHPNSESYDKNSSLNIERIKGIKLFRKYRIANLANKFINENENIDSGTSFKDSSEHRLQHLKAFKANFPLYMV